MLTEKGEIKPIYRHLCELDARGVHVPHLWHPDALSKNTRHYAYLTNIFYRFIETPHHKEEIDNLIMILHLAKTIIKHDSHLTNEEGHITQVHET